MVSTSRRLSCGYSNVAAKLTKTSCTFSEQVAKPKERHLEHLLYCIQIIQTAAICSHCDSWGLVAMEASWSLASARCLLWGKPRNTFLLSWGNDGKDGPQGLPDISRFIFRWRKGPFTMMQSQPTFAHLPSLMSIYVLVPWFFMTSVLRNWRELQVRVPDLYFDLGWQLTLRRSSTCPWKQLRLVMSQGSSRGVSEDQRGSCSSCQGSSSRQSVTWQELDRPNLCSHSLFHVSFGFY